MMRENNLHPHHDHQPVNTLMFRRLFWRFLDIKIATKYSINEKS